MNTKKQKLTLRGPVMLKHAKYIPVIFLCLCWGGSAIGAPPKDNAPVGGTEGNNSPSYANAANNASPSNGSITGLGQINPKSFGIGGIFADSLFALSKVALGNHSDNAGLERRSAPSTSDRYETYDNTPYRQKGRSFSAWAAPLALYGRYKGDNVFPALKNRALGGMLGFDYSGLNGQAFGLGLAYTYQNSLASKNKRQAKMHQELATLYGSWKGSVLFVEGALWGGLAQTKNHRSIVGSFSPKSRFKGALLSPHIKVGTMLRIEGFSVIPFVGFDWANCWQDSAKERDKSGVNLRIVSYRLSLLRSELGLEFTEKKSLTSSLLTFKQGISYVNKLPLGDKTMKARYVQSTNVFPVSVSSKQKAHLAALFLSGSFTTKNREFPTFSVAYQGEFGSKTFFHALALEFLKAF